MKGFLHALQEQRWDDHRYYHHSRINQSLHLLSALSFLCSYVVLFRSPAAAALIGWLVAMTTRQVGHFFFEPKGYDRVNRATFAYKEEVKVGYNLKRKVVLLSIWALSPVLVYFDPTVFGHFPPQPDITAFIERVALLWILLGLGALAFRAVQLWYQKDLQTAIVWLTKIVTDPFHDVMLYYKAPLHVLRGELLDPMTATADGDADGALSTAERLTKP